MTTAIALFPASVPPESTNLDRIDDVTVYAAVNLDNGFLVGEIGIVVPRDDEYGYDALWSWVDAEHQRQSENPFKTFTAAFDDLLREVAE